MKSLKWLVLPMVLSLVACENVNNEAVGTVAGGVAGGLLGSTIGGGAGKVAATVGGAFIGAILGGQIGKYMDRQDRMEMQRALETAPVGKVVAWRNPDSGNQYRVQPTRTYYVQEQPCREYTTSAIIGGKKQTVYGTACRQTDGSWKVAS